MNIKDSHKNRIDTVVQLSRSIRSVERHALLKCENSIKFHIARAHKKINRSAKEVETIST